MLSKLFSGLFDTEFTSVISVPDFLACVGASLVIGLIIAAAYIFRTRYTKSFIVTLAILPAVVCVVIMMVNGNVGAGVAVAGAFSLVRFRSVPGNAKEIVALFLAMAAGLITGMGYIAFAFLFAVILSAILMLYSTLDFGAKKRTAAYKTIRITVPENLDYTGVFEEVLEKYTTAYELTGVKTTNMGSLFRLTYDVTLRDTALERELIDELRCRNGNLEISVSKQTTVTAEL
ncbi:MAG: DUF4956 domain-containing protein [Selenomonadales bacterium]|nr:DUF4956 domain-containing protein [Selenomonadales bacterium]